MTIKAVIWDLGGVIIRTDDYAPREELAAKFGIDRAELEQTIFAEGISDRAQRGEITTQELWAYVGRKYDLSPDALQAFMDQFWAGDRVDHDLVDEIRALRGEYITGLLSNAWDDLRTFIFNEWKIDDAFDSITISAEEGVAKPDARIYEIALERAGVAPQEAVFLDDMAVNIEAARRLGMQGIHFQDIEQAKATLEELLSQG